MKPENKIILAKTIYGEARGEYSRQDGGLASLIAVGNVIMNRLKKGGWFGKTVDEVCLKPYQFSCWIPSDPNFNVISKVTNDNFIFSLCLMIAEKLHEGSWPDLVKGADHYHTVQIKPNWTTGFQPITKIGNHLFYRLSN